MMVEAGGIGAAALTAGLMGLFAPDLFALLGDGSLADARVDAGSQKQQTAAERQSAHLEQTWQEAKAAGKKVYVPKWLREQQKKKGGSGGTGSAMA